MQGMVAYIDALGFSAYTEEDLLGAQTLLEHQQLILSQRLVHGASYPAGSYSDKDVARLAESNLVDSFQHFFPFSDSTFLVSDEPNKFIRQLSNFLIGCFQVVSHVYTAADDPEHPERVKIKDFGRRKIDQENWYPPLWRGGMAAGEFRVVNVLAIRDRKPLKTSNLLGTAVVRATRLEKGGRGSRIFTEPDFHKQFGSDVQPYFRAVTDKFSELLWPAFIYGDGSHPSRDMLVFFDLWKPAVALWKSKLGQPSFEHYDEYLRLLIPALIRWAEICGISGEARDFVIEQIRKDLGEELIRRYFV